MVRSYFTHDNWLDEQAAKGVPVLSDCYVEDLRTLNLAYWDVRNCDTAFVRFTNMEGVTEARVQEIPAGAVARSLQARRRGDGLRARRARLRLGLGRDQQREARL